MANPAWTPTHRPTPTPTPTPTQNINPPFVVADPDPG
jgi:hypothetical protein